MNQTEADRITWEPYQQFVRILDKFAADREALLCIKDSVENAKRSDITPVGRRWMNKKLQEVDTYLRRVKQAKNPGLRKTGGQAAWWISVMVFDLDSQDWDRYNVATMLNPAEFIARHCREAKHPEEIPVILAFFQQPDIDSIPPELWDDTNPNTQAVEGVSQPAEPHHEAFSR